MKNVDLAAVQPLLDAITALALRRERGGPTALEELMRIRMELKKELVALKEDLGKRLSEREAYLALFPMVVHLDEIVYTTFPQADRTTWPPLQKEFFDTDRGGDMFYQTLEDILDLGHLSPVVYHLYYFALSLGFRGKYIQDPDKVASYTRRLAQKLVPPGAEAVGAQKPAVETARVAPGRSYYWYYGGALALVLAAYLLLRLAA